MKDVTTYLQTSDSPVLTVRPVYAAGFGGSYWLSTLFQRSMQRVKRRGVFDLMRACQKPSTGKTFNFSF